MSAPVQASEPAETRQLATAASIEVQETLRRENAQLRTALATRIVIEQAKGMLAERFDIEFDEAFERLRREARSRRMKLHALAAAVTAREAWTGPIFQPGRAEERGGRTQRCTEKSGVLADDHGLQREARALHPS